MTKENKESPYILLANKKNVLEQAKAGLDVAEISYRVAWTNDPIPGGDVHVQLISGLMTYSGLGKVLAIARNRLKSRHKLKSLKILENI